MAKLKSLLTPLNKIRLHEEIVEQLKDRIVRGDFVAGSRLPPERELADQLGVNRTTVREALHKLESLGLVEIKHGAGIFVKDYRDSTSLEFIKQLLVVDGQLNFDILKNLMDLRRLLVPEISYYAALNRTEQDLKDLEQAVFDSKDMPIDERDWRVHSIIARASGNLLFLIILNSFTDLAGRFTKIYFLSAENCRRTERFHREIYEVIMAGQADMAKEIMKDVLIYAEDNTMDAIKAEFTK